MGGSAFARPGPNGEPALNTPRMSRDIYEPLKKLCFDVISDHYSTVVSLHDAPEKHDFGDIDFLVQGPITYDANELIAKELNAKRTVTNSLDFTLAIPRPQYINHAAIVDAVNGDTIPTSDSPFDTTVLPPLPDLPEITLDSVASVFAECSQKDEQENDLPIYAQLDIRVYPQSLSLPWVSYLHSYGDLGQILGYLSYDLGLTSNDKGFFIRIAEQEKTNWNASMIFLSHDPATVMKFLGLDTREYAAGFETEDQLFRWVSTSRTARRYPERVKEDEANNKGQSPSGELLVSSKHQNSEHKRRMTTRPLFARFIESYLPNLPLMPTDVATARNKLLQDALVYFRKEEEYLSRLATALEKVNEEKARLLLVAYLTEITGLATKYANEIVRGIRHWVTVISPPNSSQEHDEDTDAHADGNPITLSLRDTPATGSEEQINLGVLLTSRTAAEAATLTEPALREETKSFLSNNWSSLRTLERQLKASRAGGKTDSLPSADSGPPTSVPDPMAAPDPATESENTSTEEAKASAKKTESVVIETEP